MKDFILTMLAVWLVALAISFFITLLFSWLIPDEKDDY